MFDEVVNDCHHSIKIHSMRQWFYSLYFANQSPSPFRLKIFARVFLWFVIAFRNACGFFFVIFRLRLIEH